MMSESAEFEFEALLRRALAPVEPPSDLSERLETTLANLTELAADELESWELGAMRDPRNWVRPVAATVVGTTAGAALVLLRARDAPSAGVRTALSTPRRRLCATCSARRASCSNADPRSQPARSVPLGWHAKRPCTSSPTRI